MVFEPTGSKPYFTAVAASDRSSDTQDDVFEISNTSAIMKPLNVVS